MQPDVRAVPSSIEDDDRYQEHFKTDHLLTNLKGHTISSGAVTMSAQGAKFLLSLVSTMILARLLTPRDFGLVAMVTTVTGFLCFQRSRAFHSHSAAGAHHACSSLQSVLDKCRRECFGQLNRSSRGAGYCQFYHNPLLIRVTLILSMTFLISGSTVQHQALLKRQMRFKALALIEVGSMAVGVLVGVAMALLG